MPAIVLDDALCIPAEVVDLDTFRAWVRSEQFPARGQFSFLDRQVWVERGESQTHDQLRAEIVAVLSRTPLDHAGPGQLAAGRLLLSNPFNNWATQPDGLYVAWQTMHTGAVSHVQRSKQGLVEVEGTPDMVLEVIGPASTRRDTEVLRRLYSQACIGEYWLADARLEPPHLSVLQLGGEDYLPVEPEDGWVMSPLFGQAFRLQPGMVGYTLAVRS
jgi:Uma2 family endonuclease